MIAGALLATSVVGVNVAHADTTGSNSDTQNSSSNNESSISDNDLFPVPIDRDATLNYIASYNNISINTLEDLNSNIDPNEVLDQGTLVYIPQNQLDSDEISNFYLAEGPYTEVPSYIKKKYYDNLSKSNLEAKLFIALHESSYRYNATNPTNNKVYGRFQLMKSYLHGDYSKENQEKTADSYVIKIYGSWANAKKHWSAVHWY